MECALESHRPPLAEGFRQHRRALILAPCWEDGCAAQQGIRERPGSLDKMARHQILVTRTTSKEPAAFQGLSRISGVMLVAGLKATRIIIMVVGDQPLDKANSSIEELALVRRLTKSRLWSAPLRHGRFERSLQRSNSIQIPSSVVANVSVAKAGLRQGSQIVALRQCLQRCQPARQRESCQARM